MMKMNKEIGMTTYLQPQKNVEKLTKAIPGRFLILYYNLLNNQMLFSILEDRRNIYSKEVIQ